MAASQVSGWKRFWDKGRWWKAVVAVVGYLVLYGLVGQAIGAIFRGEIDTTNVFVTPGNLFLVLGASIVVGAIILVVFLASVGWLRLVFARQPISGRGWMWIFVVLAIIPIVLRFAGIDYDSYGVPVVVTMLLIGLLIGFTEELLYRGIVIKILRDGGHRELSVAVISSLLFALSHSVNLLSGQPLLTVALTVVFTFGFGMVMYLVLRVTGNIVWPMLIHALTDPTTFLASGGIDTSTGAAHSQLLDLAGPFNIVFVIAALIALFFIRGAVSQRSTTAARV